MTGTPRKDQRLGLPRLREAPFLEAQEIRLTAPRPAGSVPAISGKKSGRGAGDPSCGQVSGTSQSEI